MAKILQVTQCAQRIIVQMEEIDAVTRGVLEDRHRAHCKGDRVLPAGWRVGTEVLPADLPRDARDDGP